MKSRLELLRDQLADHPIDCLLVSSEINVRYLSGFTGDSSYLVVSADRFAILSDRRYEEQLQNECPELERFVRGPERKMIDLVGDVIEDYSATNIGLEADDVSWQTVESYREKFEGQNFVPTSGVVEDLRQIKRLEEIDIIRNAVRIAEQTFFATRATLRPGQTELEIAHQVEAWIRHFGGEERSFSTIAAIDANAALPHAQPGNQKLKSDSTLLLDWGAKFGGYASDLTRMSVFDQPSPTLREIYPIVLEAQLAAIEAIRPGVELKRVDSAARDVITNAGYGDFFGHGLGHGIGMAVHEAPRMSTNTEGTLESGHDCHG